MPTADQLALAEILDGAGFAYLEVSGGGVSNLREAAEAIAAADRDFEAGLVYSPGPTGEIDVLIERAKALPELGAVRVLLHDPTGSLQPHKAENLVGALAEASGLPIGIYVQGSGGSALAATLFAARAGAQLVACSIFPLALSLHRVSGEALAGPALLNVLSASRYLTIVDEVRALVSGHFGQPPEPIDPAVARVVALTADPETVEDIVAPMSELREQAEGMAASEEELLLLG